jgi:hypothetical protein
MIHPLEREGFCPIPAPSEKDRLMKIMFAAAIVSFALVAPTLAMPIASPAASAHAEPAVVLAQYNHYRGGGRGHHYGWGRGYHRGWGHSHYRRY